MNNGYHSYRMNRRRRRRMMKQIALASVLALIVIGIIIAAVLILSNKGEDEGSETKPIYTTASPDTKNPDETDAPEEGKNEIWENYTTIKLSEADMHTGDLILVREGAPYVFPESFESKLSNIFNGRKKYDNGARAYQLSTADLLLSPIALEKLNQMTEDFYEETGRNKLLIKEAYRTYEYQQEILDFRIERDGREEALKYVALPGESEHHSALAFDMSVYKDGVNTYIEDEPDYLPIYENAHKYGFILRYPENKVDITGIAYEAWHFRYVGEPHAKYIYENGLCLEEYIALLRDEHSYSDEHLIVDFEGPTFSGEYEIYYVPAKADGDGFTETEIIIPQGYDYCVSGNNIDGFIVTVKIK